LIWYKPDFAINACANVLEWEEQEAADSIAKILMPFGKRLMGKMKKETVDQIRTQLKALSEQKQQD